MATKLAKTKVQRSLKVGVHKFTELCNGFEKLGAVKRIFGKSTKSVLEKLEVRIARMKGYAYIDVKNGRIVISQKYLKSASELYLTLDMVHELVHIRQLGEGKELFDKR